MVRTVLASTVLATATLAAALVPAASAAPQPTQSPPQPTSPTVVERTPNGLQSAASATPSAPIGGCGVCIVRCWSAVTKSGQDDWSGRALVSQHVTWCGNGAAIVSASAWQSYEQEGWYQVTDTYGPYWSGGCVGCASIRTSGYIFWSWESPLVSLPMNGTSTLTTIMYAYGGVAATS